MAEATMDEFLRDNHDAILVAVQEKMRGDETMGRIAAQRDLSESDLASQILGFWLQGIRSDLTLGSTVTMAQNMQWLVSLRAGHDLPFDDAMVHAACSTTSPTRSTGGSTPTRCATSTRPTGSRSPTLITDAFPQRRGG